MPFTVVPEETLGVTEAPEAMMYPSECDLQKPDAVDRVHLATVWGVAVSSECDFRTLQYVRKPMVPRAAGVADGARESGAMTGHRHAWNDDRRS